MDWAFLHEKDVTSALGKYWMVTKRNDYPYKSYLKQSSEIDGQL